MKNISSLAGIIKSSTASVKKNTGVSVGFHDPDTWISTGSYALNYRISGDFNKGIPLGKVVMFAGESGCLPETSFVVVSYKKPGDEQSFVSVVKVKTLREWYHLGYELHIESPDGWVKVTDWFDKGVLNMVRVKTEKHSTDCAVNHLLQLSTGEWIHAEHIKVGDVVITRDGDYSVLSVEDMEPRECYDFTVDHENHRYYGDGFSSHNSGKSYIVSGNIVREAQAQGIFVVLIDSENALDEKWLHALGVDTSPDKLLKMNMGMIGDVAKFTSDFVTDYRKEYEDVPNDERPKVLFVIDSMGFLNTEVSEAQMQKGSLTGDFGHKPKQLKAYITNCVNSFGSLNIGMAVVNHS